MTESMDCSCGLALEECVSCGLIYCVACDGIHSCEED